VVSSLIGYIISKAPVWRFVVSSLIGFMDPNDEDFLLFDGLAAFHRLMNTRIPIAPMQIAPPAIPPSTSSGREPKLTLSQKAAGF
jgi:hypothetical protein